MDHRDAFSQRMLSRDLYLADKKAVARQYALREHPVMKYVKGLPVEDPSTYPANQYLKQSDTEKSEYISWCMPATDHKRPKDRRCGFIPAERGSGYVHTSCPDDYVHHIRGKRRHCWSLRCPVCANDTALKRGIKVEQQLLLWRGLAVKDGLLPGDVGHWVISPPQDFIKSAMQTYEDYDSVCKYITETLQNLGVLAGALFFHPWRQQDEEWKVSPHFHMISYGRINTSRFRFENPGWVLTKIHSREKIRSIRHTAAYILTHTGQGLCEKKIKDCNFDWKLINYFDIDAEKAWDEYGEGKGKFVGDLSDIDWVEWTKEELMREVRIRYFGGVARNQLALVGEARRYRIRVCKECGRFLRTYEGFEDTDGTIVQYIERNYVYALAKNRQEARLDFLKYKDQIRDVTDLGAFSAVTLSTLELGLSPNEDFLCDGPFDMPDEFYLKRQAAAFGGA